MKRQFTSCFDMTEKSVEIINNNIELAKANGFDTDQIKALNLGNITSILACISYSLAIIADKLTEEKQEGKE